MPQPRPFDHRTFRRLLALFATMVAALMLPLAPAAAQEAPGWQLPELPDFTIDGQLQHEDGRLAARDFSGWIGQLPVSGTLVVEPAGARPFVGGTLAFPDFDVAAFRSMLEEMLGSGAPDADDEAGVIPSFALPTAALDRLDMGLDLALRDVTGLAGMIENVNGHVGIEAARLAVKPLEIRTPGGRITGESALNARTTPPSADIVVDIETVDLGPLLEETPAAAYLSGVVSGRVQLLGVGHTLEQVLATADGEISLGTREGWLSGLVIEAAGLDLIEALALYIGEDDRIPLDCGRLDVVVRDGVAEITRLIIANRDSILVGAGTLDLARETLDIQLQARAKDFSLIDVDAPVRVQGTLAEPTFSIGAPEGFPLEFGGKAEPVDCQRLLEDDFRRLAD